MPIFPARIVFDLYEPPKKMWCWRDDWVTGWDSIYGLLSKFSKLNSVRTATLAGIFVKGDISGNTLPAQYPSIDLRSSEHLDCKLIESIFRLDSASAKRAFTVDVFPHGQRKVSDVLRWCPECIKSGFHTAAHQIELISCCPLHGVPLLTKCPKCHAHQRYELKRRVFDRPFTCCRCGYIFGALIYKLTTKSLRLDSSQLDRITDATKLANYADEVVTLSFEVDRKSWRNGHGRFAIARANFSQEHSEYAGFVSTILKRIKSDHPERFAFPEEEEVFSVARGIPVALLGDAKDAICGDFTGGLKTQWVPEILWCYWVYLGIRRHLWRHVLKEHRKCCRTVSDKIWWSLGGNETPRFCPIAEAFLKWRMYWEGQTSPSDLWHPMTRLPRGIVDWFYESAPIFYQGWSKDGEAWIVGHCFSLKCVSTFIDLLTEALGRKHGAVTWEISNFLQTSERYWAVCGNDNPVSPLVLFLQKRYGTNLDDILGMFSNDSTHYAWHLKQIKKITH